MNDTHPVSKRPGYHDLYFRLALSLLAAHFLIAFGEKESFFELLLMWDYYRSLLFSALIAFILISFIRYVFTRLDKRYDWKMQTAKRLAMQSLWGVAVPAILAFLLAAVYFSMHHIHILDTLYLRFDFPVIVLLLIVLNMYYLVFRFYRQSQAPVEKNEESHYRKTFIVFKGAKSIPVPVDMIAYFFHEGDFNFLRTTNGEDFLVSQSLDEVQAQLDPAIFFRANRQMLIGFGACKHFEPLEFNKLALFIEPPYKEAVIISQKRAKGFKDWMER
jgi:DNA-binding LytR/AlgR family response regulator